MVTTYCQASDVAAFMGVDVWDGSSKPTLAQVEAIINRWEDTIDRSTGHAWRTATSQIEYYNIDTTEESIDGELQIKLKHRQLTSLTNGTDTLEIWDGGTWVDYLADKTEGRGSDYWVNESEGILYLVYFPGSGRDRVKIQYRYGDGSVPGDITDACTKYVAADLLQQDDRSFIVPEGGQNITMTDKSRQWKLQADAIIHNRVEVDFYSV